MPAASVLLDRCDVERHAELHTLSSRLPAVQSGACGSGCDAGTIEVSKEHKPIGHWHCARSAKLPEDTAGAIL